MRKRIILSLVSLVILSFFLSAFEPIYAAINTEYYEVTSGNSSSSTSDSDSIVSDSSGGIASTIGSALLTAISKFVFAVARLVKRVVKRFSNWLFGVDLFPWADLIVYNTLPYLDINFFNPASGSFTDILSPIIKSVYFSLLTLSLTILGIGVSVTAIRLAVSSIAAEKAKYKETLTKCLYTVVMLFSVHILMSFIFYLNEQICVAASNLLTNLTAEDDGNDWEKYLEGEYEGLFLKFIQINYNQYLSNGKIYTPIYNVSAICQMLSGEGDDRLDYVSRRLSAYYEAYGDLYLAVGNYLVAYGGVDSGFVYERTAQGKHDTYSYAGYEVASGDLRYFDTDGDPVKHSSFGNPDSNSTTDCIDAAVVIMRDAAYICSKGATANDDEDDHSTTSWINSNSSSATTTEEYSEQIRNHFSELDNDTIIDAIVDFYETYVAEDAKPSTIITTLGATFEENAYGVRSDDPDDNSIISVYLYAIFIIQSIMLLISYFKRLFFVIILSVLAPIVVIYDFFMGESNKVFTTWIKELCSLVFVQAMQALLITIMLAIVIRMCYGDGYESETGSDQSMGVYAIFMMMIIPKVELLVKRIFGLGSGVADVSMSGGQNSLTRGLLAMNLGKRVLNNAGKFVGGVGKMASSAGSAMFGSVHAKKSVIAQNNERALNGESTSGDQSTSLSGGAGRSLGSSSLNRSAAGSNTLSGSEPVTMNSLTQAIRNANAEDPQEAYEKARHENAQRAREGLKQAVSGVAETAGAIGGASLGAVYSMGTGGDNFVSNMVSGAGIGDAVGEGLTNATLGTANRMMDWNYDRKQLNKKLKEASNKQNNAGVDENYRATVAAAGGSSSSGARTHSNEKRTVKPPSGVKSAKRAIKSPASSTPKMPQTPTNGKNTSRQLSSSSRKYYDKALEAKNKGDMEGYKQNRQVAADMMRAEKNAVSKANTKKYTNDTKTQLKASTMADINRVNRNKQAQSRTSNNSSTSRSYTASGANAGKISQLSNNNNNSNETSNTNS